MMNFYYFNYYSTISERPFLINTLLLNLVYLILILCYLILIVGRQTVLLWRFLPKTIFHLISLVDTHTKLLSLCCNFGNGCHALLVFGHAHFYNRQNSNF